LIAEPPVLCLALSMSSFNRFSLLFPKFALGNELVAGIPLVFAGSAKTVNGLSIANAHAAKSTGTIIAINGALRMDQISGLVQTGYPRKLELARRPKNGRSAARRQERSMNDLERASCEPLAVGGKQRFSATPF